MEEQMRNLQDSAGYLEKKYRQEINDLEGKIRTLEGEKGELEKYSY